MKALCINAVPLVPPRQCGQRRARRLRVFAGDGANPAAGAAGGQAKKKQGVNVLSSILSLSSVPYSSYVPEPRTFLHAASAEAKQFWSVAVLLLMSRASSTARVGIAAFLVATTMATLPPRLWRPQLARLGGLCALVFVFTAIGSDGVPPVLSDRGLGAAAAGAATGGEAAAGLPASMAVAGAKAYRYVLLHLGPVTVTKRSLSLAVAIAGLTFTALQSASLCLVTTPSERMAVAVGRALRPLGMLGLPVKELMLTVLLALRFMATVFEECRNLCLGLASRGVDWRQQGLQGTVAVWLGLAGRLFVNLMARCESIAVAMTARGFRGPEDHALHVDDGAAGGGGALRLLPSLADCAVLLSLVGLAALCHIAV